MKHRLFVAINLPQKLKNKLSRLILELQKRNKRLAIKWVASKNLHLTLHFLGYLNDDQISEIKKILNRIKGQHSRFKMRVGEIGGFPNLNSPKVIFIDSKETENKEAQKIQKELSRELQKIDLKIDKRPWQEHITLARVKAKCQPKIPRVEITDSEFEVGSIELMESELGSDGPRYSIVESFELD